MAQLNVFGQFKEYVLSFGRKNSDNEIGPPQLRFRFLECALPDIVVPSFGLVCP
jgi:hypothetical protein